MRCSRAWSVADAIEIAHQPATVASLVEDLGELGNRVRHDGDGAFVAIGSWIRRRGRSGGGHGPHDRRRRQRDAGDAYTLGRSDRPCVVVEAAGARAVVGTRSVGKCPAYDPNLTPTRSMGVIPECFRHLPGVIRSSHPVSSAAAVGPNAAAIVEGHELVNGLGEGSPQGRLYGLDGHTLLLGVSCQREEHLVAPCRVSGVSGRPTHHLRLPDDG